MGDVERELGLGAVKVWHFNDSKGALASKLDRHTHIGEGEIGLEGFRFLMNDPRVTGNTPGALMDCGQAIAQATLVAYDEGLGSCLMGGPVLGRVGRRLKVPETAVPLALQAVGYPAESWEAGGQTVKPALEELFHEMEYGTPFRSDPAVVAELEREGLLQAPAPLPWRDAELRALAKATDLETKLWRDDAFEVLADDPKSSW